MKVLKLVVLCSVLLIPSMARAALWDVYEETTYLWNNVQTKQFIYTVDDTLSPVLDAVTSLFGVNEVFTVSTNIGEIVAKIQYTNQPHRAGWTTDNTQPGDYIVQFRAIKRP